MRKVAIKARSPYIFLFVMSNNDAGMARKTVFQEVRPGASFKTGDFVKEKLGGLS